ncbi:MAG: M48 family metallopeptidase [Oscillospiraceae bacterium]|nr:M48 family metallopeptidase [Oscillospiraceae bacterium]
MNSAIKCPSFEEYVSQGAKPRSRLNVNESVEFAHPIDATIIKVLDNKLINELFSKYVGACVDLTEGLALASSIKVDENSQPELYAVLNECADKLGIDVPYTVISRSVPGINAQTVGTDEFSYIAISSLLNMLLSVEEQKFVLGHECGHVALGHVVYHTALRTIGNFGNLIPVVGAAIAATIQYPLNAWSRKSEISADRAGLICCGDVATAKKALLKLEAGFMNIDKLDVDDYLENTRKFRQGNALGKFTELFYEHPIIPKRMEALDLFANSEKYYRISGQEIPEGKRLLSDKELEKRTNEIIKILL